MKALVTAGTPLVPANWRTIGDTSYYVQVLGPPSSVGLAPIAAAP